MSVAIRLAKVGRSGESIFRIVVVPARSKRDGKNLDKLGFYNPSLKPPVVKLDKAKYEKWLKLGAKPSAGLRKIIPPEADKQSLMLRNKQ